VPEPHQPHDPGHPLLDQPRLVRVTQVMKVHLLVER
jgi:hypothetical protein